MVFHWERGFFFRLCGWFPAITKYSSFSCSCNGRILAVPSKIRETIYGYLSKTACKSSEGYIETIPYFGASHSFMSSFVKRVLPWSIQLWKIFLNSNASFLWRISQSEIFFSARTREKLALTCSRTTTIWVFSHSFYDATVYLRARAASKRIYSSASVTLSACIRSIDSSGRFRKSLSYVNIPFFCIFSCICVSRRVLIVNVKEWIRIPHWLPVCRRTGMYFL